MKMYRNKKDVDKHVESLMYKLTPKDFKTRALSIAHLYYEVGDYKSCQKYVEQFITQKSDHAAAYKLLGQAFQKLGEKEKALEQYKTSFDINPNQTTIILDVCDLLADEEVAIDSGRAKYWCDKAQANFPNHPITYRLRERLLASTDPDPEALVALLKGEIESRPNDAVLHARLLKHYLKCNKHKEAFEHSCNIEFEKNIFSNNYVWYETLSEILVYNPLKENEWLNQLLLLTVREKLCNLSLSESPIGPGKGFYECSEHLHDYDQAIQTVAKYGAPSGFGEFHAVLLNHHQGQLVFHAATFLLKKAKKDQLNWREAKKLSAPLMLLAWQTHAVDTKVNWLTHAPDKQRNALHRWYIEGSYRCSQAGHYLQAISEDKSQVLLDQISQLCSGSHWKDKLYEKIFTAPDHVKKIKTSFLASNAFKVPILKLPRKIEIQAYDHDAQIEHPNSLHHFVWILLNYKNYADFKLTLFDMLTQSMTGCGPETLNKLDAMAFLYCATLTTQKQRDNKKNYSSTEKLILPANITDILCTLPQMKWWDCAYKLSQNQLGVEYTDIRSTLSRGIEVVRCVDNHGLDPELLTILGRIFNNQAKTATSVEEKTNFELRACLYYSSAIPLLEKLKNKVIFKVSEKRMFDYIHDQIETKELNNLLEESKLYVALNHLNDGEYEKVINILSCLKSPEALYHLSDTYKRAAMDEKKISHSNENETKFIILLEKAKKYAFKALDKLKETEMYKNKSLYSDIQSLIEEIELHVNKIDPELSPSDQNYPSSDENISDVGLMRPKHTTYRNVSSTPKQQLSRQNLNYNTTAYRTATDTHILDNTQMEPMYLERIEKQIKSLQKRDASFSEFKEQTKDWFEENRKLGSQIISTINSNIESTKEQFKLLKISLDQVKEQIDEYRTECKDVVELKKQITELKKEVNKLKKSSSEQTIDENDLYMGDENRSNDNTFGTQLPFPTPQVIPPFAQRLLPPFSVPSNPYQLYGQNFYNLYNQYSQFAQPPAVPGAPPIFDPSRAPVNYPGVYPTQDQMYLDPSHLVPTSVPAVPTVSTVPVPAISTASAPATISTSKSVAEVKEKSKSLPGNVVITSSEPLPTSTTTAMPVLSVTIPQKHIKSSPHNYQIPMPVTSENKVTPPVFSFPSSNKSLTSSTSSFSSWNSKSIFMSPQQPNTLSTFSTTVSKTNDDSKNVVDGVFPGSSPNTSLNKSRTLSERSNTSIENYDPCPDFKPIIPLPAEVKVTTGEEDEVAIFSSRAKLFRFVEKQWKERGIGDMKLLKHKVTGKVRVLMRREQVHKICANHIILPEMEIKPMKNESKAYFWVANDFAEETVILEKFCIRFKTADIAKEFYETFEKSRKEATTQNFDSVKSNKTANETENNFKSSTPIIDNVLDTQNKKTVVGGFTFTSKPSFKLATSNNNNDTKIAPEVPVSKVNVFSGLTFKTATSSPFSNLLNVTTNVNNTIKTPEKAPELNKLNTSDTVEEFVPTAEFKPVIPLPALIEHKTGEEDEIILYEHRAKLLRFDAAGKEWKERGLGNIKLLVHKENNQKLRLLMRREQIMKVCCNHTVTKEMTFQKMPNVDKAVTWYAQDFSEGELVAETFCLRFKTVQACDEFIDAVKTAQSKLRDDTKAAKEEQNAAKQNNQVGFGDKFKPKPGSWYCQTCYTNNLETFTKCACCETEKPKDDGPKTNDTEISSTSSDWGAKFKPKPGSWECKECYIRNEGNIEACNACNSPRDPTAKKAENKLVPDNAPKFNFGIPPTGIIGDSEKKKSDSKFTFGIPQSINVSSTEPVVSSSLFNSNVSQKFSFGIPQNKSVTFGAPIPAVSSTNTNVLKNNDAPLNFAIKKKDEESITATPVKPALLPTPKVNVTPFGHDSGAFEFSFKPKTPSKGKSPIKSPKDKKGDESDDNEYASEDEGHHIHFSPVIPMPDKIEVVTGEENEDELYGHRARLFRFSNGEWKERGTGVVKILKHKDTGKIRVVMRREQVLKICLNHALVPDNMYKPKDDRTWFFVANDFSEGEVMLQQFCIRFANKEIAMQFKDAIDKALLDKFGIVSNQSYNHKETEAEDVIFITEIQATSEEKEKAKELLLPENFYTYKNKEPCQGCRGCDDDVKPESEQNGTGAQALKLFPKTDAITPLKTSSLNFQTPNNSVYGTPSNLNNTVDTTIFRTPLSTNGSNTNNSSNTSANSSNVENDLTNKENTWTENSPNPIKTVPFGSGGQLSSSSSVLAAPKLSAVNLTVNNNGSSAPKSVFGSTDVKSVFGSSDGKSILPETKSVFGSNETKSIFGESKSVFGDNKSIFGESKPIFSQSSGKPILGFNVQTTKTDTHSTEVTSIFSPDVKPSVNLFSGTSGGSIFGLGALKSSQSAGIFGASEKFTFGTTTANQKTSKSIFAQAVDKNAESNVKPDITSNKIDSESNEKFVFGKSAQPQENVKTWFGPVSSVIPTINDNTNNTHIRTNEENRTLPAVGAELGKKPLFESDNALTFAALSSTVPGFGTQKNNNFQWEGAGQQLFTTSSSKEGADKSKDGADESGAGVAAEEDYDPHYEPIVPLPDKITVTTGEEDEEKLFGERCKLYRFDEKTREWKERGVGEMKILYHPERNSYRLLLRREQVHKAVLNMLLFMDLELLPMKNSDRAWTWAGQNYAESSGEQETLAVRFKSIDLATAFRDKVMECVRKLQVAAAEAIRKEKEAKETQFDRIAPLRLPKQLGEAALAETSSQPAAVVESSPVVEEPENNQNGLKKSQSSDESKQVHFEEPEEDHGDYEEEDYEHEYDHNEDSDGYYNDDEETAVYYPCKAIIKQGDTETVCEMTHVHVSFDQEICSPKILVTDSNTGEILADMLIHTDTEFQLSEDTCSWSGLDFTTNVSVEKTLAITFIDSHTAMEFYDSCETSKAATFVSTDPES